MKSLLLTVEVDFMGISLNSGFGFRRCCRCLGAWLPGVDSEAWATLTVLAWSGVIMS